MFSRIPWYPTLLAGTFVLNLWIVSGVSLFALSRAFVIAVAVVTLAVLLLSVLTRRPHVSAAAVAILFAAAVSRGELPLIGVVVFPIAVGLLLKQWARIQRRPLRWTDATRAMNVLSVTLLGLVLIDGLSRGTFAAFVTTDLHQGTGSMGETGASAHQNLPDVIVLLLDGYPRTDVVTEEFGFDNSPFVEELEARGFEVAAASESNYPYTQATLISMLHMRPLHEIERLDRLREGEGNAYPLMRQVANENPVFDTVRRHGYRVISTSPGYEHVTLRQADVFLDDASLNEAERQIIRDTPMQRLIDWIAPEALLDQYRQRIIAGFDELDAVIAEETGSTFAVIHIPSPHQPVVLARDGSLLPDVPTESMFRADPVEEVARKAFQEQLAYLNERTLAAIDRLLEPAPGSDEGPVIVLLSDHGSEVPARDGAPWNPEHYKSFLAVRGGSAGDVSLGDDATPVNLFPAIFAELFGEEHPTWPNEQFPWTDIDVPASPVSP
jgi:hypothetical protein